MLTIRASMFLPIEWYNFWGVETDFWSICRAKKGFFWIWSVKYPLRYSKYWLRNSLQKKGRPNRLTLRLLQSLYSARSSLISSRSISKCSSSSCTHNYVCSSSPKYLIKCFRASLPRLIYISCCLPIYWKIEVPRLWFAILVFTILILDLIVSILLIIDFCR